MICSVFLLDRQRKLLFFLQYVANDERKFKPNICKGEMMPFHVRCI